MKYSKILAVIFKPMVTMCMIFFKENKDITVLHCMAHARRKFFEAKDNNPAVADYALKQIGLLYAIDRKAKEQKLTADEIFEFR